MQKNRCVFMASDPIAIPSLDFILSELTDSVELVAVYTQPDRRTGRGKKLTPNAIKLWAESNHIEVFQPLKMDDAAIAEFQTLSSDLVIVMAYGHILPKRILSIPTLGFVNLHASLLPKLRGASPIETAIVIGESKTGVTLMEVVPALDAGPIIAAETCEIDPADGSLSLREKLAKACVPLLQKTLPSLFNKTHQSVPQIKEDATYCRLIDKTDGYLDFNLTTQEILDHIRGFQPWPGALFEHEGIVYRIGKAKEFEEKPSPNNGCLICDKKRIFITTKDTAIEVLEIQKPGGKMLPSSQFLNGHAFEPEIQLSFPERFPLVKPNYFKKQTTHA